MDDTHSHSHDQFTGCYNSFNINTWHLMSFTEKCNFEFGLKCMYLFWDVKNLFLDGYYIFVDLCYFDLG